MEAVTESSTTNTVEAEVPTKEVDGNDEMGVPEEVSTSEKNVTDKELSWEKIAAEIAAEEEPKEKSEEKEPTSSEPVKEETVVEETVINTVTEEKIVTEADSSEVIEKPIEVVPEPLTEAEPIAENTAPTAETIPVDEVTEVPEVSETVQVNEVIEITEEKEVSAPPEPVEEIVETPAEVIEPEEVKTVVPPQVEEAKTVEAKENEVIEISEVKQNETVEVTETIDEIEYTVLDPEEVETHEIIEEHLAQSNSKGVTETVVIINPDQSQTEITIEQVDDDHDDGQYTEEIYVVSKENEGAVDDPGSEESETKPAKPKKQRGRKPIADIPLHVLGRDITKPSEGVSNGGRTMPKPRLGVKVPYRNLTSQIVSKQEIEKEIMERFKLKQEQNASNSGDILFARKLTQRLAKKLIPSEKDKEKNIKQDEEEEPSSSNENPSSEIKNNSDLIAILEGEGDDIDLTQQKKEEVKKSEKEIALEQLKELPGKNKVHRKEEEKKVAHPQKEAAKIKGPVPVTSPPKPVEKKSQVEVEPRLKTGMVIKTYTRKRKSTDMEPILPPKKAVVAATTIKTEDGSPGNVYMTKSSRVIKRKVIWDPDEAPSKSPLKAPKLETPTKQASPVKPVEKKETVDKIPEKKTPSPVKKVVTKSPLIKKQNKRLTEIDRLLMDEGAVNMLYDVKTNEETTPDKLKKKTNKNVISLDKAHKELMSKTNVIKNDLQQNTNKDVQKSLRKKEIVSPPTKKEVKKEITPSAITRKKSKDSARSSVHTPPSSPPYNAAEASRIIRRHSSSSFSSNAELSDEEGEEKAKKKTTETKKKVKKTDSKPVKEATKNNNNTVTEKVNHVDKTTGQYKSFTATKKNKLVSIKLQSVDGKCYLNEQVLQDLISFLKDFGKDNNCHVVSITSDNNESFCEGLDYRLLVADDDGARKKKANELASLVKEFLRCLLKFPKVIVAGIQGDCVGLGVTMLPLFDMVIASDTSTFRTPYSRLGCVPEAGFLLTVPHLSSNGLASELFYTSQTIKADDAFRRGLVTRLCWPEKYQQELKSMLSQVASQSIQSIMATKQQLRQNIMETTESSLSSISKVLVEYWTSPECQKNFSK